MPPIKKIDIFYLKFLSKKTHLPCLVDGCIISGTLYNLCMITLYFPGKYKVIRTYSEIYNGYVITLLNKDYNL